MFLKNSRSFDGYVDKEATEKKIVRDVLQQGDMWFRSGDLLFMDEFGWMYFVDRLGDTFR
jgi:acyl-CoA synthetase (AMP-forming)/AMP-acid ligase II